MAWSTKSLWKVSDKRLPMKLVFFFPMKLVFFWYFKFQKFEIPEKYQLHWEEKFPTQSTPNRNLIIGYSQPAVSIFDRRQLDYDFDILELLIDCSLTFNILESEGCKLSFYQQKLGTERVCSCLPALY